MTGNLRAGRRRAGFTLIELLVSMAIVALLLALAVPRYFGRVEQAKETVLRENLHQMRDAIDKFYGDNGRYPASLQELVARKYLRRIPPDPLTDSNTGWVIVAPTGTQQGGVFDIRSGAPGKARDGTLYNSW
ncbi:prepilin-type N-terminal cleavage/methylation domain-containing protein [Dechloromonas sp. XY25]|uniref:Prepilin-type N-terminal cleavage/methylation domain-containing protein n=1 Tax=Dechloromonas hankyongensis TaxID=2908002 RepID=A0ABS9K636_9RHOO|nr:prepilin-type N-terminal cleavage/methylation domain-containing protein [Dechloromonas hankyongensis]MCG2578639.1 prepilin-type N-terminal cleavage/methylation domain-containing protein [Dechloromonas hankyongensis]